MQETLLSLISTGWFQEQIQVWFTFISSMAIFTHTEK